MSGIAAASGGRPVSPFAPAELARRFGPRSSWEVVPGQVWRAAAGTLGLLVLIVEADVTHARVMPVVPDDELQTDQCWVLEPRLTSFSSVVTVWAGVAVALPYLALDRPIDTWGPPVLDAVLGGRALAGMHRGHAHGDGLDAEGAAELADELEALIAATEIPEVQSPAGGPAFTPSPQQLVALEAATGLPMPEVLAMGDGRQPIPGSLESAFLDVMGYLPVVDPLPAELVGIVSQPSSRGLVEAWARRQHLDALAAVRSVAREQLTLAARQTGGPTAADWRLRLERWAQAQGIESS